MLGLWCCGSPTGRYKKVLVRVIMYVPRKKMLVRVTVCWCFPRSRKRKEILVRVMVSQVSQKLLKRNVSQAYDVLAFQEAVKENYILGLCCFWSQKSRDRKVLITVIMYFFSQKPRKKIFSQGYEVKTNTCQKVSFRGFFRSSQR